MVVRFSRELVGVDGVHCLSGRSLFPLFAVLEDLEGLTLGDIFYQAGRLQHINNHFIKFIVLCYFLYNKLGVACTMH